MIRRTAVKALVCALASIAAFPSSAEDLRLTATTWPPYVDAELPGNGFVIELVSKAFQRAGYKASMTVAPWPEALEATQRGDYDVLCSLWYTDERAEALVFSEPYIDNQINFVKQAESEIRFKGRADLEGLRIGVVNDYAYSEQPYDTSGIQVTEAGSVKKNLQRLLSGDIDLVLADRRVALYEINTLVAAKRIAVLPQPLITRGLRIAVSKQRADHVEIIDRFEKAMAAMKADGTYDAILAIYRISY